MKIDQNAEDNLHDRLAPYWAISLLILIAIGIATVWVDYGAMWRGYVLDIVGPAWTYILFRGLFTYKFNNRWTRFFTPLKTFLILLSACYGIEVAQFLRLYEATFDPWDFLAYVVLLGPMFLIDLLLNTKE
ncbi:hypothetical protein DMA11_12250 [Marinilabiliaceae bacterium JC017]|nr:hypothetical protein DMA11_12250 [Marinilabiliaceae bacterium JC017]